MMHMKKSFRTVFILLMLVCTAVLIWYVPASARLRQDTALRREELVFEQGLLKKQLEKDPIEALDKILFYQDKLDGMLSPELAELLQYDQVLRSRKDEKSRLQQDVLRRLLAWGGQSPSPPCMLRFMRA